MRSQRSHSKPVEKAGINESLHLPSMAISQASPDYAESITVACPLNAPLPNAFGIVRDSA
jgi:hypothetical protein